jgi:hypothetical protein
MVTATSVITIVQSQSSRRTEVMDPSPPATLGADVSILPAVTSAGHAAAYRGDVRHEKLRVAVPPSECDGQCGSWHFPCSSKNPLDKEHVPRSRFLGFAHVLIGKPVPTFPGHALIARQQWQQAR